MLIKANTATMCKSIGKNAISIYSLPAIKSIFFADWNSTYTCPDHFTTIISLESSIVGSIRISSLLKTDGISWKRNERWPKLYSCLEWFVILWHILKLSWFFCKKKQQPPPKKTHIKITHIGACKLFSKQYQ